MNLPKSNPRPIKEKKQRNPLLVFITVLLVIQVLLSGYSLFQDVRDQAQHRKLVNSVADYTNTLDELTTQMLVDYKVDVYNNANVNTTAKQAVMASEYNFNAIMLLVKQNTRIMEILTQVK